MSGNLPVLTGPYYQRGHGLGAVLGMLRGAVPFLKPVLKSVGKSALRTGMNVASDVMAGKKIGQSLKSRATEEVKRKFNQSGRGHRRGIKKTIRRRKTKGRGIKRRRKVKCVSRSPSVKRRRIHRDIFS